MSFLEDWVALIVWRLKNLHASLEHAGRSSMLKLVYCNADMWPWCVTFGELATHVDFWNSWCMQHMSVDRQFANASDECDIWVCSMSKNICCKQRIYKVQKIVWNIRKSCWYFWFLHLLGGDELGLICSYTYWKASIRSWYWMWSNISYGDSSTSLQQCQYAARRCASRKCLCDSSKLSNGSAQMTHSIFMKLLMRS